MYRYRLLKAIQKSETVVRRYLDKNCFLDIVLYRVPILWKPVKDPKLFYRGAVLIA